MPTTSYESTARDAMPEAGSAIDHPWVELPSHRETTAAVIAWLASARGPETFRVGGAYGVGKSHWFRQFATGLRHQGPPAGKPVRWVVARFGRGEPVVASRLVRQWADCMAAWVERPVRYRSGPALDRWLELAMNAQEVEGYQVVRMIESDRARLHDDPAAAGWTRGVLWLAREPFRGSRTDERSIVMPVWSHDELGQVLARLWPAHDWTDSVISRIWAKSTGRARPALKLASALADRTVPGQPERRKRA